MIPESVPNHVDGKDVPAASGEWLDKLRPADGSLLCRVARSGADDVAAAVAAARRAQPAWAARTASDLLSFLPSAAGSTPSHQPSNCCCQRGRWTTFGQFSSGRRGMENSTL